MNKVLINYILFYEFQYLPWIKMSFSFIVHIVQKNVSYTYHSVINN